MRVKIIVPAGYGDRFGVFHALGDTMEIPDERAQKLMWHRIVAPVAVEHVAIRVPETPIVAEEEPQPKRKPGRPRKEVFPPKEA